MKNYCALAFDHVMVRTDGTFDVCCEHKTPASTKVNIKDHDHIHWQNSGYVQQLRTSFLLDQRHPGCERCWQQEDQGFDSLRIRCAKEYKLYPNRVDRPVKNVEICLGNLCNLRCLMCSESGSSAILAENAKLGINKIEQEKMAWNDVAYQNVTKLIEQRPYVLNIRGGEPFINKKLLEIVNDIPVSQAQDMVLHITTNATVWNTQWQLALEKFRLVRLMISLDAIGDLYEYIRFPASWQLVEKNVKSMLLLPNAKCLVHCVGQNLNISSLSSLIAWCETNAVFLNIQPLSSPAHMHFSNLPVSQKNAAIQDLDLLTHRELAPHLANFVCSAHDLLQKTKFDNNLWKTFVTNVSLRDNLRGNNFRNFIKADPC